MCMYPKAAAGCAGAFAAAPGGTPGVARTKVASDSGSVTHGARASAGRGSRAAAQSDSSRGHRGGASRARPIAPLREEGAARRKVTGVAQRCDAIQICDAEQLDGCARGLCDHDKPGLRCTQVWLSRRGSCDCDGGVPSIRCAIAMRWHDGGRCRAIASRQPAHLGTRLGALLGNGTTKKHLQVAQNLNLLGAALLLLVGAVLLLLLALALALRGLLAELLDVLLAQLLLLLAQLLLLLALLLGL